jgi:hypothetical protein
MLPGHELRHRRLLKAAPKPTIPGSYKICAKLWTLSGLVQLADSTFLEDLSHTLRVAYYRGANDSDLIKKIGGSAPFKYAYDPLYLTDKDYVWEVNFDHRYKIYENLTAVLELGYLRLSADRDTWHGRGADFDESDSAWKAEVTFSYSF